MCLGFVCAAIPVAQAGLAMAEQADPDRVTFALAVDKPGATYAAHEPVMLRLELVNHSGRPQLLLSHVIDGAHEKHFDQIEIELERRSDGESWHFRLEGLRKASAAIACELAPGATLRHEIDLSAWASRVHIDLGAGEFRLRARYSVPADAPSFSEWSDCTHPGAPSPHPARRPWHGTLVSNPVTLEIAAP